MLARIVRLDPLLPKCPFIVVEIEIPCPLERAEWLASVVELFLHFLEKCKQIEGEE